MSTQVHTSRMGFRGLDWLDITRGNKVEPTNPGGHLGIGFAFAPSSKLLRFYLERRRTEGLTDREWLEYVENFTREMRESYRRNRPAWDRLLAMPRVVLLCFCSQAAICHRTVLARDILPKLGAKYMGELS